MSECSHVALLSLLGEICIRTKPCKNSLSWASIEPSFSSRPSQSPSYFPRSFRTIFTPCELTLPLPLLLLIDYSDSLRLDPSRTSLPRTSSGISTSPSSLNLFLGPTFAFLLSLQLFHLVRSLLTSSDSDDPELSSSLCTARED